MQKEKNIKKNMNMKKSILFVGIVLCLLGCKPVNPNPDPDPIEHNQNCFGIHLDYSLYLKVQNELGENLLNTDNPNHIDINSVNLYFISKDGCEMLIYSQYADISKGFIVLGSGNDAVMQIVLDGNGLSQRHYHGDIEVDDYRDFNPETLTEFTLFLKWNSENTDIDTIRTTFIHLKSTNENPLPNGYCQWHLYDKIYYNDELMVSSWEDNKEKYCCPVNIFLGHKKSGLISNIRIQPFFG